MQDDERPRENLKNYIVLDTISCILVLILALCSTKISLE